LIEPVFTPKMKVFKYIAIGLVLIGLCLLAYMKVAHKNTSELGLEILSSYKKASGNQVKLEDIDASKSIPPDHLVWTNILQKNVTLSGKVDYRGMIKNKVHLQDYLDDLSENPPAKNWSQDEKLAYWINAYNAFTVKLIIDHYPLKSIKEISSGFPMIDSPWDLKFFKIGKVAFDLNTIEHDILRKQFDEPRIHFAINCASISCPKLRHEAYLPKYLEFQLNDQAASFINNKDKNQVTETETRLSQIFNWFQGDFTKNESLIDYISRYNSNIKEDNRILFAAYNWSLNQ
jgi:hypothetical protein